MKWADPTGSGSFPWKHCQMSRNLLKANWLTVSFDAWTSHQKVEERRRHGHTNTIDWWPSKDIEAPQCRRSDLFASRRDFLRQHPSLYINGSSLYIYFVQCLFDLQYSSWVQRKPGLWFSFISHPQSKSEANAWLNAVTFFKFFLLGSNTFHNYVILRYGYEIHPLVQKMPA